MKSRALTCITAMIVFALLAMPVRLGAQHHRYKLIDLGTFGSYVYPLGNDGPIMSPAGAVVGQAETSIPVLTTTNSFCNPGTNIFAP